MNQHMDRTDNRILQSLGAATFGRVNAVCERVHLAAGTVLARDGEPTPVVCFPETAVISTLATYGDGSVIEMANVGREACTGINLMLGRRQQFNTSEVQIGGRALILPADACLALRRDLPEFERVLLAGVQSVVYQVMISGACNGRHTARQRIARWLLSMQDRTDTTELRLTQEFLAQILGLRRATVSETAAALQSDGQIAYGRGRIRITDRKALQRTSCECYERAREACDAMLPQPATVD